MKELFRIDDFDHFVIIHDKSASYVLNNNARSYKTCLFVKDMDLWLCLLR